MSRFVSTFVLAALVVPSVGFAKKPAPLNADDPTSIQISTDIKVVFHATQDVWKKGVPQTLFYVDRLVHLAYPEKLGIPVDELDFKVVAHDAPVYWFLDDDGWKGSKQKNAVVPRDHNPHKELIQGILDAGVTIEVCGATMAAQGYTEDMLLPGIQVAPAGLPRVIDLQLMGYQRLSLQ